MKKFKEFQQIQLSLYIVIQLAKDDFRQQKAVDFYNLFFKFCIEKEFYSNPFFWECFIDYCWMDRIIVEETLLPLLPESRKQDYFEFKMKRLYNK